MLKYIFIGLFIMAVILGVTAVSLNSSDSGGPVVSIYEKMGLKKTDNTIHTVAMQHRSAQDQIAALYSDLDEKLAQMKERHENVKRQIYDLDKGTQASLSQLMREAKQDQQVIRDRLVATNLSQEAASERIRQTMEQLEQMRLDKGVFGSPQINGLDRNMRELTQGLDDQLQLKYGNVLDRIKNLNDKRGDLALQLRNTKEKIEDLNLKIKESMDSHREKVESMRNTFEQINLSNERLEQQMDSLKNSRETLQDNNNLISSSDFSRQNIQDKIDFQRNQQWNMQQRLRDQRERMEQMRDLHRDRMGF